MPKPSFSTSASSVRPGVENNVLVMFGSFEVLPDGSTGRITLTMKVYMATKPFPFTQVNFTCPMHNKGLVEKLREYAGKRADASVHYNEDKVTKFDFGTWELNCV